MRTQNKTFSHDALSHDPSFALGRYAPDVLEDNGKHMGRFFLLLNTCVFAGIVSAAVLLLGDQVVDESEKRAWLWDQHAALVEFDELDVPDLFLGAFESKVDHSRKRKERRTGDAVPSIAPLANRIPLSRVDVLAHDRQLVRTMQHQYRVAEHFAKKFRIPVTPLRKYVNLAVQTSNETKIDPLLILSVISVESNFNPHVRNKSGAEGLMQVMTRIHKAKFMPYGGASAVFKPEANIRVGSLILKHGIAMMGSLPSGLRYYVGAALPGYTDGGFVAKVLGEYSALIKLLGGEPPDFPALVAKISGGAENHESEQGNPPMDDDLEKVWQKLDVETDKSSHVD